MLHIAKLLQQTYFQQSPILKSLKYGRAIQARSSRNNLFLIDFVFVVVCPVHAGLFIARRKVPSYLDCLVRRYKY